MRRFDLLPIAVYLPLRGWLTCRNREQAHFHIGMLIGLPFRLTLPQGELMSDQGLRDTSANSFARLPARRLD